MFRVVFPSKTSRNVFSPVTFVGEERLLDDNKELSRSRHTCTIRKFKKQLQRRPRRRPANLEILYSFTLPLSKLGSGGEKFYFCSVVSF